MYENVSFFYNDMTPVETDSIMAFLFNWKQNKSVELKNCSKYFIIKINNKMKLRDIAFETNKCDF